MYCIDNYTITFDFYDYNSYLFKITGISVYVNNVLPSVIGIKNTRHIQFMQFFGVDFNISIHTIQ